MHTFEIIDEAFGIFIDSVKSTRASEIRSLYSLSNFYANNKLPIDFPD